MNHHNPTFLVVDLFCGFGGTTLGFEKAGNSKVVACVNHDPKAIKSHWLNHPEVTHFEEDIRTLDLTFLTQLVRGERWHYPEAKLILWASLECTNFSKAKGGQPRDADSRTLADHLPRYITALNPDYIMIENVVEFMAWGPLDENGKPVSRKNGQLWNQWRNEINKMGYRDDWKELNSANFGAFTSRNRLFGCFAKDGLPIKWPTPTHAKNPSKSIFKELEKWKAVKDVLHLEDEGKSIFDREKPLSDKTLERIYAGLLKFVANGDTSFLAKYYSGRPEGKVIPTNGPAGAILTSDHHSLIQTSWLLKYNSVSKQGKHSAPSIDEPCPTIATQNRLGYIKTEFLQHYYGNGFNTSTNEPCPTITTKERAALVQPKYFIKRCFSGGGESSIDSPAGSITSVPKMDLVKAEPFVMNTNFNNVGHSIHEPGQTITANRKWHYLINPSWGGNPSSTDQPCCVIVARQDKAPLYLTYVESGNVAIGIYESDSKIMIRIKEFMAIFGLIDIKMRMLRVEELLKIQGFPEDYEMVGSQSDRKKFIGNSVEPNTVKAWILAMAEGINQSKQQAA